MTTFPALKDGTILRGRYRLTRVVGQGGMGNVYRAEDLRLPGRLCAIKEVLPDPGAAPDSQAQAQSQFLQEASILAQLDHPNLPKVSDFFADGGNDYLVMDFVPGKDLKEHLEESRQQGVRLSEGRVLGWSLQIIDALAYLHGQEPPVLHRDIKPANIKLTPDGRIKLVDFGLVKLMDTDDARTITVVQGRGTALYTPLEQYGGDAGHTDARTDIYALGATFYHLLTDFPPSDAKARFLNPSVLRPPHVLNPDISLTVSDAVMWAMEMHPDDRPANVTQFGQALRGNQIPPPRAVESGQSGALVQALAAHKFETILALGLLVVAILLTFL